MSNHSDNSNTPDSPEYWMVRSIKLAAIAIPLDFKPYIQQAVDGCTCRDCAGIRRNMGLTAWSMCLPQASCIIQILAGRIGTDAALDCAGRICYLAGQALMPRRDLPAKLMHDLEQRHAHTRQMVEAKRLLLWFHEELHKVVSSTVQVSGFDLPLDELDYGPVRFNAATRARVKAAALELAKSAHLPRKD